MSVVLERYNKVVEEIKELLKTEEDLLLNDLHNVQRAPIERELNRILEAIHQAQYTKQPNLDYVLPKKFDLLQKIILSNELKKLGYKHLKFFDPDNRRESLFFNLSPQRNSYESS